MTNRERYEGNHHLSGLSLSFKDLRLYDIISKLLFLEITVREREREREIEARNRVLKQSDVSNTEGVLLGQFYYFRCLFVSKISTQKYKKKL